MCFEWKDEEVKKKNNIFSGAFSKLAAEEEKFFKETFLCPVVRNVPLRVKLSGITMTLRITSPKTRVNFEGWGVFRPTSVTEACFVREATLAEYSTYLNLFPQIRLITCGRTEDGKWLAMNANANDSRFQITGLVPLQLAGDRQLFETVRVRFDGKSFWLEAADSSASLRNAAYLRNALVEEKDSDAIEASGLTKEERQAYAIAYLRQIESKKDRNEERIKLAIERAGAEYRSYVERGDTYTVEYTVDGERHQSVVNKDTLDVQSAGICLSGGDRTFDLQSLVGVIKEGIRGRRIVRVGLNTGPTHIYTEDDYDNDY